AAGLSAGFYSSPHLLSPRERFRLDGRLIEEAEFARLFSRALEADPEGKLTYFELMTSVAFQWFAERGVDAAVIETGLGGRFDATTVLEEPLAAVISSIGFDHTQYLGSTLAAIAGEKAAIAKRGRPLVCAPLDAEAMRVVRASCAERGAQ